MRYDPARPLDLLWSKLWGRKIHFFHASLQAGRRRRLQMTVCSQHIGREDGSDTRHLRIAIQPCVIVNVDMVDVPRHAIGEDRHHVGSLHSSKRIGKDMRKIGRKQAASRHRHVQREIDVRRERLSLR